MAGVRYGKMRHNMRATGEGGRVKSMETGKYQVIGGPHVGRGVFGMMG